MKGLFFSFVILVSVTGGVAQESQSIEPVVDPLPVGISGKLEQVILPAPELIPQEIVDSEAAFILRRLAVYPHGDMFRYDFEFYGLEPGDYDLMDYLRPVHGGEFTAATNLIVRIKSILPPGQIEPAALEPPRVQVTGGYKNLLTVLAVVWGIGLIALILWNRQRKPAPKADVDLREPTAQELLTPLAEKAIDGSISLDEKASLERIVLGFWRRRLQLENLKSSEAMTRIKADPEAGQLLRAMEEWLHRPGTPENVDLKALLKPYSQSGEGMNRP